MNKAIIKLTAAICKKSALNVSASACWMGSYQPKEPKCLSKEK